MLTLFRFPAFPDFPAFPEFSRETEGIRQDGDAVILTLDVPGYSDQDLKVQVESGNLIISGDLEARQFRKVYTMTDKIDLDGITALAKHGVLTIKLPFKAVAQPRHIQVN